MKKIFLLFLIILYHNVVFGNKSWLATGGIGLTVSPTLLLINPQLEYRHDNQSLYYGPLIQMGIGEIFPLFTLSGSIRYMIPSVQKIKPSLEGGIGLAISEGFKTAVGVHIMMGMGFDYVIDKNLSIGTMVRANFAPPMKTFFLSWPIMLARIHL